MAYAFSTNRYLWTTPAPASGVPMTLAAWFNPAAVGSTQTVVSVGVAGSGTGHRNQIVITPGGNARASCFAVQQATVDTAATVSTGTWNHLAAVFSSLSSRTIYLNGANAATSTATISPYSAAGWVAIGVQQTGGALSAYLNGRVADVAVWNVTLTAEEIASLAKGTACNRIRPQSLVFYAPIVRNLTDAKSGRTLTNTNGATVFDHPRVYA